MPQRSVYIREEDDDKWQALKNKAEFIHNALNPLAGTATGLKAPKVTDTDINRISKEMDKAESPDHIYPVIKTPKDAEKAVIRIQTEEQFYNPEKAEKLCKIHGTPLDSRGRCLIKGCKYA